MQDRDTSTYRNEENCSMNMFNQLGMLAQRCDTEAMRWIAHGAPSDIACPKCTTAGHSHRNTFSMVILILLLALSYINWVQNRQLSPLPAPAFKMGLGPQSCLTYGAEVKTLRLVTQVGPQPIPSENVVLKLLKVTSTFLFERPNNMEIGWVKAHKTWSITQWLTYQH